MRIVHVETLISQGSFSKTSKWSEIRNSAFVAVKAADWPPGSGTFTIYPQSGKKRGEANGVKPIKNEAILLFPYCFFRLNGGSAKTVSMHLS